MVVEREVRAGLVRDRQESQVMCRTLLDRQAQSQARICREESQLAVQHAVDMAADMGRKAVSEAVQTTEVWCERSVEAGQELEIELTLT